MVLRLLFNYFYNGSTYETSSQRFTNTFATIPLQYIQPKSMKSLLLLIWCVEYKIKNSNEHNKLQYPNQFNTSIVLKPSGSASILKIKFFFTRVLDFGTPCLSMEVTILGKNSFPPREVTKIIHLATAPNTNTARSKNDQPKPKYCSLTYIPKLSEALKRQIEYFIPEVTIANRPDDKLGRIYSKQKDKLDDMQQSDVVYRIKCSICQSMYIGETCQRACTRKQQHKNSVSQTNLAKPKTASALALHTKTTGHAFDFDSMKILDRQRNKKKLQVSEVNHIIMNREVACNYKQDTEHIAPAYSNILRQYASKRFPTRNAGA
ncbi:hypothetical protein HA402_008758 [Bradysia odoriphaga]|nr:hypothetical protein HA402_008758 [Bradysia odoriphaga]